MHHHFLHIPRSIGSRLQQPHLPPPRCTPPSKPVRLLRAEADVFKCVSVREGFLTAAAGLASRVAAGEEAALWEPTEVCTRSHNAPSANQRGSGSLPADAQPVVA